MKTSEVAKLELGNEKEVLTRISCNTIIVL
jgi:hypothetical protein